MNKSAFDPEWARAKKICHLNQDDIRMAKELGFKPRSLIKNIPNKKERWKQPIKQWIRELYEKSLVYSHSRGAPTKISKNNIGVPNSFEA